MTVQSEAMLTAKYRLIDEIRRIARKAAEFECSANNYDRSRSEAPEHIGARYYGDGEHDARWYAVHGALTGFNERIATDIEAALATYRPMGGRPGTARSVAASWRTRNRSSAASGRSAPGRWGCK